MQPPAQEVSHGQSDVRGLFHRKYHSALALFFRSFFKHLLLVRDRAFPGQVSLFLCQFSSEKLFRKKTPGQL